MSSARLFVAMERLEKEIGVCHIHDSGISLFGFRTLFFCKSVHQ
jgi:hypothetical protein